MTKHKWHKEIKAWADGAEIQYKDSHDTDCWVTISNRETPMWFTEEWYEYRIKPQPKEPQYLYVYRGIDGIFLDTQIFAHSVIGKIKLEQDDENI